MVQHYEPPEGFDLDSNSGLYYRYDYVTGEDGVQTCWMTWFNAESGEYNQQIYEEEKEEVEDKQEIEGVVEKQEEQEEQEENYLPPEGFLYHEESGLYYRSSPYQNEEGQRVDFVTWFDTKTGEYTQMEYPEINTSLSFETDATKEKCKDPEGSEANIRRGILAIAAVVLAVIVGITWYFNIWDHIPIPFFNQTTQSESNLKVAKDCKLQVKVESATTAVIRLEVPNLNAEYEAYDKTMNEGQIMYDWRVQFGDYAIALMQTSRKENKGIMIRPKDMQSSLWKYKDKNHFDTVRSFVKVSIDNNVLEWNVTVPDDDFDFRDLNKYIVSVTENGESDSKIFSAKSVVEKQAATSPSFAHCNMYELMADEDEDYVYTIYLPDPYWKFSMEGIGGPIYRIKKDDKKAVPEKIIDLGDGTYTASSLAVLGDYIYFSTYTYNTTDGVDQYAYFRVPKKGGKAEKLFEEAPSYIRAYDGKLYFLFTYKNEYGVYDPQNKKLSHVNINTIEMYDPMQGGARSEFHLFLPFSVYQGDMYLGGSFDYVGHYSKVSLADGKVTQMARAALDGISENDEGAVFLYGTNPLYLKNIMVVNTDSNAFICRTSENRIAVDKTPEGQGLVFKPIYKEENGLDNNKVLEVKLSENSKPYAGVGSWIFLNDRAICIENDVVKKTVQFSDAKDKTSKWNMSQVKESVN